jgi:hypothetical protein
VTPRISPSPWPKSYPKTAFPFTPAVAEDERLLLLVLGDWYQKSRTPAAGREPVAAFFES